MAWPHGEEVVAVYDETGNVLGLKRRPDIDRLRDILAAVFVFVRSTKGELLTAVIPDDAYRSRQAYVGKIGFPVASFLRHGETADHAARRALQKDLSVDEAEPAPLGTAYHVFDDGIRRHASVFLAASDGPFTLDRYAASSVAWMSKRAIDDQLALRQHQFAPSFVALYAEYKHRL